MTLNLPLDEKLAASINRRRIAEDQRKQRIFNAKQRQIGIDVDALKYQMHDKALERAKLAKQENELAEASNRLAIVIEALEQQEKEDSLALNKNIDQFRLTEQKPWHRRDYDLYDPDQLKKEHPPRLSDNDPCPISGLQRLEGEDLNYKDRMKRQKQQMRDFLLQQIQEKRMQKYKYDKAVNDWEIRCLQQDFYALQVLKSEEQSQREMASKLNNLNHNLAIGTKEKNLQEKISDEIEKRKEIENTFYGDLLTENPSVARSVFGPHRVIPDRWKGMSKKQLEEYRKGQIQQIIDNKRKNEKANFEKSKWESEILSQDNYSKLLDEENKMKSTKNSKDLELRNKELEQEQKLQQKYMNSVVYTNVPTQRFFNQFNTSSR